MFILLLGGPGSGKSSVSTGLKSRVIKEYTEKVFFIAEAFSTLYGHMPEEYRSKLMKKDKDTSFLRQFLIAATQISMVAQLRSKELYHSRIIFADRSLYDASIYEEELSGKIYGCFEPESLEISIPDIVLLFKLPESAPHSAEGDLTYRIESDYSEAKQLEEKTIRYWEKAVGPEKIVQIPVFDTIDSKVQYTADLLNQYFGKQVFDVGPV